MRRARSASLHIAARRSGHLATGVEPKEVNRGSKVTSFTIAVDRNAEEAEVALLRQAGSHRVAAGTRRKGHGAEKGEPSRGPVPKTLWRVNQLKQTSGTADTRQEKSSFPMEGS